MEHGSMVVLLGIRSDGGLATVDLKKTSQLLLGGIAGSGKTTWIHSALCALVRCNSAEEVKLVVCADAPTEYAVYQGLPHLMFDIADDASKAVDRLKWAVDEMKARYIKFRDAYARNLDDYNQRRENATARLPRIVVVVDGLQALMIEHAEAVDDAVMRLATLGRAAGIHLIFSTQRVQPMVLSGIIKANFPNRIAFCLPSKEDSRMLLDEEGAERLERPGDMLCYLCDQAQPERLQGCYVSEAEIRRIVADAKK